MRILVVNDDGINEEGVQILLDVLKERHDVWAIAPDKNRSGVSNGITMKNPLCLHKIAEKKYTCSGLPVDCTIEGCKGFLDFTPEVVLSGINRGANIGTDILYSGTAAGARQSSLYNIPGIAVSLEKGNGEWNFKPLAEFVLDNLEELCSLCEKNIFVNINAHSIRQDEVYKGVKMTVPAIRDYCDGLDFYKANDRDTYSFFKGGDIHTEFGENTDNYAVDSGFISVSQIYAQPIAKNGDTIPSFTLRRQYYG
ncbi:MAG: hypothetical protein BKP49_01030 [Treponema sp. CETP13]|nr:MAG: hypothetical protein BKP49_01030 [Treponema sp. CETP13]